MHRRAVVAALMAGAALSTGCREGTVRIERDPHVGDRARYRYEIDATVTRSLEGGAPRTTHVTTVLRVDQRIVEIGASGVEAEVTLRRDGAAPRTARVVLDETGAIRDIELVAGLDPDALGLAELRSLLPTTIAPPGVALAPGAGWTIAEGELRGTGRLLRLGTVDDVDVAVVRTTLAETVDDAVSAGASEARLTGVLRSVHEVSYDLDGGGARRASGRSHGTVQARIEPPAGVDAEAVRGTIRYDVRVQATRVG